jgi:mono/diheme cytochrome c family protein
VRPQGRAGADGARAGATAPARRAPRSRTGPDVARAARLAALAGAVAVAVAAAACGSSPAASPTTTVAVSLTRGQEVYEAKCASCHGTDLQGTDRGPSHLSAIYEPSHHSDESFRRAVRHGAPQHHWRFGPMPPVEGVSDADLESVIAFVRAEQRERGFSD